MYRRLSPLLSCGVLPDASSARSSFPSFVASPIVAAECSAFGSPGTACPGPSGSAAGADSEATEAPALSPPFSMSATAEEIFSYSLAGVPPRSTSPGHHTREY